VDRGIAPARAYDVRIAALEGSVPRDRAALSGTTLPLSDLGGAAARVRLTFTVEGSAARPAVVDLAREEGEWVVARVRHGG
jgi:hypothetical protein